MKTKRAKQRSKNKMLERVRIVTQCLFLAAPFLFLFMIKLNPEFQGLGIDVIIETHPVILVSMLRICCLPFIAFIIYKMDFYTQTPKNDWYVVLSLFVLIVSILLLGLAYFAALLVFLLFTFSSKVSLRLIDLKQLRFLEMVKKMGGSIGMLCLATLIFVIAKRVGL